MRIKIDIDFEVPERMKRALRIAVPLVIVLGGSVAFAGVPTTFKDGDPVSAQTMNENFASVDKRIGDIESRISTKASTSYRLGASYCGSTPATKGDLSGVGGAGNGYAKARAACQTACGGSTSAHMCLGEELVRAVALGVAVPAGWYESAASTDAAGIEGYSCFGWISQEADRIAPFWRADGAPSRAACNTDKVVLCCD
jgi:hypothetical protein